MSIDTINFNAEWVVEQVLKQMRESDKKISAQLLRQEESFTAQLSKQEETIRCYHQEIEKVGAIAKEQMKKSVVLEEELCNQKADIAEIKVNQVNTQVNERKILGFASGVAGVIVIAGEAVRWWFDIKQ